MEKRKKMTWMLILQLSIMLSSLSGVCSKMAGRQKFLSFSFLFWFGAVIGIMGIYAIIWQQILKRMPLTVAYANKAMSLIWGMIWGALLFQEHIKISMIIGAVIIGTGIYLVVSDDE